MHRPGIRRLMGLDLPRRSAIEAELEEELRFHLDQRIEQLVRGGLGADEARRVAFDTYGPLDAAHRDIHRFAAQRGRRMRFSRWIDSLTQDFRFGARSLVRNVPWTIVAIVTLALGIGANTAVFSIVNDLLIEPLRYPEPDRLVLISRVNPQSGFQISPTRRLREQFRNAESLDGVEGVSTDEKTLYDQGDPRPVRVTLIPETFLAFAGARVLVGRGFTPEETAAGGPAAVMLSEHEWRTRYDGSTDAPGRTLNIDGRIHTIIGVVEDGVRLPSYSVDPTDFWLPLTPDVPSLAGSLVARLAPGANAETARAELQLLTDALAREENWATQFQIRVREPGSTGQTRQSLLLLTAAVALLLLVACANVAHLLIARGAARHRELSIRAALGAGRSRIVSLLLAESLLLSLAGGVAALVVGAAGLKLLVMFRPDRLSELVNAQIDGRVLGVTLLLSVLTGVMFGLTAGYHGIRTSVFGSLRQAGAASSRGGSQRIRSTLVVTEMALSVMLVFGATLLIRSVANLYAIDPGLDADRLYATVFNLPTSRYPDGRAREEFARRLDEQLRAVSGVESFTIADNVPTRSSVFVGTWEAEGVERTGDTAFGGFTAANSVRPEFFDVMGMPLLAGRTFDDGSKQRHEVIASEQLARMLWGRTDIVGRRFRSRDVAGSTEPGEWQTVVGVVADASLLSLREDRITPALYFPSATGAGFSGASVIVRARPGQSPAGALRAASLSVDPLLPPPPTLLVRDMLQRTVSMQRFLMALLAVFAGLAVVLSAVGLYGVISHAVSQRRREIGIRVALGARPRVIAWLVMQQSLVLALIGLAIGIVGAIAGARLVQSMLFGVSPLDVTSFVASVFVLLLVAAAAGLAPTTRAVRVDPAISMRAD